MKEIKNCIFESLYVIENCSSAEEMHKQFDNPLVNGILFMSEYYSRNSCLDTLVMIENSCLYKVQF